MVVSMMAFACDVIDRAPSFDRPQTHGIEEPVQFRDGGRRAHLGGDDTETERPILGRRRCDASEARWSSR
jgi:hypothetical protein